MIFYDISLSGFMKYGMLAHKAFNYLEIKKAHRIKTMRFFFFI